MAVLVGVTMTHVGILLALPRPFTFTQFSYRLETYVLLELCAAVLATLVLASNGSRRARPWKWMAIPVCLVSLVGAIQQISAYPYPGEDRYLTQQDYGEVAAINSVDYQDTSQRTIPDSSLPRLAFPFEAVHGDSVSATVNARPGTLVATNIAAGSYLVHVTGAKPVGVDSASGDMVLEIARAPTAGSAAQETVTVSAASSLPIVLGRVLTACGIALLALQLLLVPGYRLLLRRVRSGDAAERDRQRQPV